MSLLEDNGKCECGTGMPLVSLLILLSPTSRINLPVGAWKLRHEIDASATSSTDEEAVVSSLHWIASSSHNLRLVVVYIDHGVK